MRNVTLRRDACPAQIEHVAGKSGARRIFHAHAPHEYNSIDKQAANQRQRNEYRGSPQLKSCLSYDQGCKGENNGAEVWSGVPGQPCAAGVILRLKNKTT